MQTSMTDYGRGRRAHVLWALGLSTTALFIGSTSGHSFAGAPKGKTIMKDAAQAKASANGQQSKSALAAGVNAFTLDLYGSLKTAETGNVFLSPYSVAAALSMTNAGARGNTQAELSRALHFDQIAPTQAAVHQSMGALLADLNAPTRDGKPRGFRLAVANRLFGAKGAAFVPDFLALNANIYGAPLEQLDFAKALEPSRQAINTWVEQKTNNKVKELIQQGNIDEGAKLVLVNAIYFNADWAAPFVKPATREEPFFVEPNRKVSAPLMLRVGEYKYFEDATMQAVELPYSGNELSMIVLLPSQKEKLATLEGKLSADNLRKWESSLQSQRVEVRLPKFKMTWGVKNLVPALRTLGISDAFTFPKADFSGIDGGKSLVISLVLHKTFVDVNEEGTEAAAATAVVMAPGGAPPPMAEPKKFRADRPFLFLIRDNASGTILFIGRVSNPVEAK